MEFGVFSSYEFPDFPFLGRRNILFYIITCKIESFYTKRITYSAAFVKGRPKVANYAAYVANIGAQVENSGVNV